MIFFINSDPLLYGPTVSIKFLYLKTLNVLKFIYLVLIYFYKE